MTNDLSATDAAQVRAILMTHSEMQDQRIHCMMSRVDAAAPSEIEIKRLESDSDNLKRLAQLFT